MPIEIQSIRHYESVLSKMSSGQVLMLDFWATWCGPCQQLAAYLTYFENEYSIIVGKVNIDDNDELADMFDVSSLPTCILIKDGQVIDQQIGMDPSSLDQKIKQSV